MRSSLDELYARLRPRALGDAIPCTSSAGSATPADREVVGFCAAGLAFGRVASVLQSIEALLALMGPRPARFVRAFDPAQSRSGSSRWGTAGFAAAICVALMLVLQRMLRDHGSIEALLRRPATTQPLPTCATPWSRSRRGRSRPICAPPTDRTAEPRRRLLLLPAPVRPAAPASASTCFFAGWFGATRSTWACGGPVAVPPGRAARHARGAARTVPAADAADQPRLGDGVGHHGVAPGASTGRIPCATTSPCATSGMMNACGFNRAQRDAQCPLRGVCQPRVRRPRSSPRPSARR